MAGLGAQYPTFHVPRRGTGGKYLSLIGSTHDIDSVLGVHEYEFSIQSLTPVQGFPLLYECNTSHSVASVFRCSSTEEALDIFRRYETHGHCMYRPLTSYKNKGDVLVLGDYVGMSWENWLKIRVNNLDVWKRNWFSKGTYDKRYGMLEDEVKQAGLQLCTLVTKSHQNGRSIGNIKEGLFVKPDLSIVILPDITMPKLPHNEAVVKDLRDLHWFVETLYLPFQRQTLVAESWKLFHLLFPQNLSFNSSDMSSLLNLSYIICHTPLFWGEDVRFLFADIAYRHYLVVRSAFPSVRNGSSDVGYWWNNVLTSQKPHTNVFRGVYNVAIPTYYQKHYAIVPMIRNALHHHHQHDIATTRQEIDAAIVDLFPNVYLKLYLAMSSSGTVNLKSLLENGSLPINYAKN